MRTAFVTVIVACGCITLCIALIQVGWNIRCACYEPKRREAMRFCESLIPHIEAAARQDGEYPSEIDPRWIGGKRIPALVRIEDFYLATNRGYLLRFRNPGAFWNDIWGYHGGAGSGSWMNYDGY